MDLRYKTHGRMTSCYQKVKKISLKVSVVLSRVKTTYETETALYNN